MENPPTQSDKPEFTVLIVDDDLRILHSLKRLFRHEPFAVESADSGGKALELLEHLSDVAVIISDQRLPVMGGSEFLQLSRNLAPDAIRILLTGYSDINATISAINEGGASRYISKPWEDEVLLQTVRDNVRNYSLLKENRRQQEIITAQNRQLQEWNDTLKQRITLQTSKIRSQFSELQELSRHQRETLQGVITVLTELMEMRSPVRRRHADNIMAIAAAMAKGLALPAEEQEQIKMAALLHDIGKNVLPDVVLARDVADLDQFPFAEKQKYLEHPVLGQAALNIVEELRPVGVMIRHHHEYYDGNGFPDGLSGTRIPIGSQLIALADELDNELSRNFGRNTLEKTMAAIAVHVGTRFSPEYFPLLKRAAHELHEKLYGYVEQELEAASAKLNHGTVDSDLYHLVTTDESSKSDAAEIMKVFSAMAAGRIEGDIMLLNYYHEIPVNQKAAIVEVETSRVEFQVHELQAIIIKLDKRAIIQSDHFKNGLSVYADLSYVNVARKIALLRNFKYAEVHAMRREVIRVKVTESLPVTFSFENISITGNIVDISETGISINVNTTRVVPAYQAGLLSFMLSGTPLKVPGVHIRTIPKENAGQLMTCTMQLGKVENTTLNAFIYKCQVQIIQSLKDH